MLYLNICGSWKIFRWGPGKVLDFFPKKSGNPDFCSLSLLQILSFCHALILLNVLAACRFVLLCDCILLASDSSDSQQHFADDFLLPLLSLHSDKVPNVRISLARTLAKHSAFFGTYTLLTFVSAWFLPF